MVPAGTRVQLRWTLLEPSERAAGLPDDTAALPYVLRVRGVLIEAAAPDSPARVRTASGRVVAGTLEDPAPSDDHTFGRPPRALAETWEAIDHLRDEVIT